MAERKQDTWEDGFMNRAYSIIAGLGKNALQVHRRAQHFSECNTFQCTKKQRVA